ncbi:flavin reductase family protein [Streptomyces sp. NPDC048172]|uniref:flavin reductase family protein n=1 Tax=Streptomyces sp. NPDC048172 TaxID=3365505 RepID=UPI003713D180
MTSAATRSPHPDTGLVAVMRHFVTGVTVLTSGQGEETEGVTVSTFTVVTGAPPLACVALRSGSRGLRALLDAQVFVANGLSAGQEALARHFARRTRPRGLTQLPPTAWLAGDDADGAEGLPRLSGAAAWLTCRTERTVALGDHELVVAHVVGAAHTDRPPLLSFADALHPGPMNHRAERES